MVDGAGLRPKVFAVHPDMIGRVVEYDGYRFAVDFHPASREVPDSYNCSVARD